MVICYFKDKLKLKNLYEYCLLNFKRFYFNLSKFYDFFYEWLILGNIYMMKIDI